MSGLSVRSPHEPRPTQSLTIRLPVHVSDDVNTMLKVTRILGQKVNREPSAKEVAAEMGVDLAAVST